MIRIVFIILIALIAACSSEREAHTVEWYLAHPDERKARQEECKLLGMKALEDRDCIAASEAHKKAMMKGFSDVGARNPKEQYPALNY